MAYTVKQVSTLSGVSVRALRFYHESGLLKPARVGANGYRYYEQAQLLILQQILFYRELGLPLKKIRQILGRRGFETTVALESHRRTLETNLARIRALLATIDHTLNHLKGRKPMSSEQIFAGFTVAAGADRTGVPIRLGGEPHDCKLSGADTDGGMCVFEFTGHGGGPEHSHHGQDEWIYIVEGEFEFRVGKEQFTAGAGQFVFIPRTVPHAWGSLVAGGKVLNVYQPAGNIEGFFRELSRHTDPPVHVALGLQGLRQLFKSHDMDLLGPPLGWTGPIE